MASSSAIADRHYKTFPFSDCGKEILSLGEYKLHREMLCKALKAKAKAEKTNELVMQDTTAAVVATIQFPMKLDHM